MPVLPQFIRLERLIYGDAAHFTGMRTAQPLHRKKQGRARKLPVTGAATGTAEIRWDGRVLPMMQERNGVWRVRSRSSAYPVDLMTGTSDLAAAKARAKELLDGMGPRKEAPKGTLEEVAALYLMIPKKCADDTAAGNISRLRSVVAVAFESDLGSVKVSRLPDLWHTYVAKRQQRQAADYSQRARVNISINTAMRQAASIFRRKLWPHYRRAGVILPEDCATVEYLPQPVLRPAEASDADLCAAWAALAGTDRDLWLAVGLARFAGLRQAEILACRGKWILPRGAGAVVQLQDHEEDGHRTKTGRLYTATVLDPSLAAYLLALEPEAPVIARPDAARWLGRSPQQWLRQFTAAPKPLHRLRGLYADQIQRETQEAILARAAGVQAASAALGHTTTTTTERHYLTPST